MEKVFRSCVIALVLTGISYFSGGVRFSFGSYTAPPLALQLAKNFIIFSSCCFWPLYWKKKSEKGAANNKGGVPRHAAFLFRCFTAFLDKMRKFL